MTTPNDYTDECVRLAEKKMLDLILDETPFPTSEEAKAILREEGIDTTELKSWASGKLAEIKAKHGI